MRVRKLLSENIGTQ
jgi:hypothetical protein